MRLLLPVCLLLLTGCYCAPEPNRGEGYDTNYFDNCYNYARTAPRRTVITPKDAL